MKRRRPIKRVMREVDLSAPVSRWLNDNGLAVCAEVQVSTGYATIDLVGWNEREIVGVELKVGFTSKVLHQAYIAQMSVDRSFVAVKARPTLSRNLTFAAQRGIGVLWWDGDRVHLVLDATGKRPEGLDSYYTKMRERLKTHPTGGAAGLPTLKGEGPAIRCKKAIASYLEQHPDATWIELFQCVPNHYMHLRSFRGHNRGAFPHVQGRKRA